MVGKLGRREREIYKKDNKGGNEEKRREGEI